MSIVLGPDGIAAGQSFGLVCGGHVDRWHFQFASHKWGTFIPWQVRDPAALEMVRLFRYDGARWTDCACGAPRGRTCDVRIGDPAFGGPGVYFVRVTQADRERAWSSPIWVKAAQKRGRGPEAR